MTLQAYPLATDLPRAHRVRIVTVPDRRCLAVDGDTAPGSPEFQAAMSALYTTAYTLHFLLRERGINARVSPPEALWERRDGRPSWADADIAFEPAAWQWTLLIGVPEEAGTDDVASAIAVARRRHPAEALDHLYVRTIREGVSVEAMHVGPYDAEPDTIARMHEVAREAGLRPRGAHHEIYLGDPRRTDPRKLRTVLRQPLH
ncbi:MAG TPA: GyrI-like domain-containing protein [Candidatus Dormibacteraeota bacterium]|nr:GyrI-like domain-containing protein [Candidatus Dormibacteraeota bacterium]